ncbi:MAG: DUF438 domain-containing protein [Flavobacteriales bacterium]|nr:DUF438 domain-containing protein [Flavobacteriales bacterium]
MNTFLPTVEQLPEGHPVKVYYEESELIQKLITELRSINLSENFQEYYNAYNQLCTIEKRFARKENQLFPYLEKHGWDGPSQGMWSFHDNLRDIIRLINQQNEHKEIEKIKINLPMLLDGIERLLNIEDMKLFPNSMQLLTKEDWEEFYEGDEEVGWMLKEKPTPYPKREDEYIHPSKDTKERKLSFSLENTFHYDEGYMTPEQVNLLLRFLPVDITYVDENDRVIFYNRGEERVFTRSKGIIGREVKFCHPPKSVHMVLRIVDEFRAGTKDVAEFWINFKGRMIHIRYFAIRDKEKNYRGVIEMSQDVTEIQKLEGQKRLLDWD